MNKLFRIISIVLPCLAVTLIVVQVVVSNELATMGKSMGRLDLAVNDARDVHAELETEVASASSLMTLHDRALILGFREPTPSQIVALSPELPVAFGVRAQPSSLTLLP